MTDTKIETQEIVTLLRQSELFSDLSSSELEVLSTHAEFHKFFADDEIIRGLPIGGHVYMMSKGDVSISKPDGEFSETVLARFIGGECFGELDLFNDGGNPVTVRAETEGGFLVFPGRGHVAAEVFSKHPSTGAKVFKSLLSMVARRIRSTNQLISQRSPWVQELRKLVHVDKLTGLFNKTWLIEELPRVLGERRAGSGILIIKPDKFKTINDTYGHEAGDKTLALLAETVQGVSANKGTAARHGGDVFAVICKNSNLRDITRFTTGILRTFRNLNMEPIIGPNDLAMTVSVGVCIRPPGAAFAVSDGIETAFTRMLSAREAGGDQMSEGADG
ncbi:MAG: GGDEF domain-containing protein [Spirochaetales bacterium]|nr:GGDEF domain-containing protein [Spirochaetales bacterium]